MDWWRGDREAINVSVHTTKALWRQRWFVAMMISSSFRPIWTRKKRIDCYSCQMNTIIRSRSPAKRPAYARWISGALLLMLFHAHAHASIFKGEALDRVADVLTWAVLVIAPIVVIGVFLIIHILPEKIAERKHHPQTEAIKTLCLLSLFFGGMLWPLAWLWAYSKPVLYKLAYGTDKAEGHDDAGTAGGPADVEELNQLRKQVAELESRLDGKPGGRNI